MTLTIPHHLILPYSIDVQVCPHISRINTPNTGNEDGRVKVSEAIAGANVVYTLEHGLPFQYVLNRDGTPPLQSSRSVLKDQSGL